MKKSRCSAPIKRTKNGIEWTLRGKSISVGSAILWGLRQQLPIDRLSICSNYNGGVLPESLSMTVTPVGWALFALPDSVLETRIGYVFRTIWRGLYSVTEQCSICYMGAEIDSTSSLDGVRIISVPRHGALLLLYPRAGR